MSLQQRMMPRNECQVVKGGEGIGKEEAEKKRSLTAIMLADLVDFVGTCS